MNWIALIAGLAVATLILGFVIDLRMTSCRTSTFYAVIHLCSP
ncbi:hypothetical protein ACVWZ6_007024 [Bradyrhizobium sp. GM6.1]|jgi:hypothetical protein